MARSAAEEEDEGAGGRVGVPVDRYRVLRALLRGKWWILAAGAVGLAIGVGVAKFVIPRVYMSEAILNFDGIPELPEVPASDEEELASIAEGFFTDEVLKTVKKKVGLPIPLQAMAAGIQVDAEVHTGAVRVSAGAETPKKAMKYVDTLVRTFLARERKRYVERLSAAINGLNERITAAEKDLATARGTYDSFRRLHGIADVTTEQGQAISAAADLRTRTQEAESEIAILDARIAQLRRDLQKTPTMVVASSSSSSPERAELARLETELARARASLSEEHPRVRALREQIGTLRGRITSGKATPVTSTTMGASTTHEALRAALTTAQADLEAAKQRVLELRKLSTDAAGRVGAISEIEGEAAGLLAQVNTKENLLNQLKGSLGRLEDVRHQPPSGFTVVASAEPPQWPERDKRRYIAAFGFPLVFLLLAIAFFLAKELRGLKLLTPAEVGYWGGGPVIGTTTWPRDPGAVEALIADLDDYVPGSKGRLLLVGATEEEAPLARELASELNNDWVMTTYMSALPATTSSSSTALAERRGTDIMPASEAGEEGSAGPLQIRAWEGEPKGQALRRAARLVDRVAVVVRSGARSAIDLKDMATRLGREDGIGYIVVGIDEELTKLPDRAGPVEEFWANGEDKDG